VNRFAIARGMRPNRHPLDADSATRMLQGAVHPDDAPPGYGPVAGLLASASVLPTVDEDAAGATVSAMVEAIRGSASNPETSRRTSMLKKLLAGKALAAVGVIALTASGAAAATGSLPDPVQNVVAGAVSHVGIDIPQPGDEGHSADHRQDGNHRQDGAHNPNDDTTSTTAGTDDSSGDQGHGQEISDIAHQAKEDGKPVGPTVCAAASDGKCQAGDDHGKGSGDNGSTTSSTVGSGSTPGDDHPGVGNGPAEDHESQAGADHEATSTTVTTASQATGEDHSGGKPGDSGDSGSSGRH
jgi:hypothetical protein